MGKSVEEIREEIKGDIAQVMQSFDKYKEGGFKIPEIAMFVFEAGTKLVEAVQNVQGVTGAEKKQMVISTVKDIYKKVNPDIPYIPEPFETMLENIMLEQALNQFIDFIVTKYKEKKIFK